MKRNKIFILLLAISVQSFSQNETFHLNIMPASPNAANFTRYGEIPVNYSTGVPNINIPLYTIECGQLKVPISISYHASGIKVRDIASPVGLGWVLNSGGLISKTVLGNIDDFRTTIQYDSVSDINRLAEYDKRLNLWSMNKGVGGIESQSDRFNFFYPGNSGVFRYRYQSGIPSEPVLIPFQPLRIEKINTATIPGFNFKIIAVDGTEYYYEKWDKTTKNGVEFYNDCNLTKIISPDKTDTILYKYELTETYQIWDYPQFYYLGCKEISSQCVEANNWDCGIPQNGEGNDFEWGSSISVTTYQTSLLTSINTKNTTIQFTYMNDRQDIRKQRLSKIEILSFVGAKVKEISFDNNVYFGSIANAKRLKINSLLIKDANSTLIQKYSFQYNTTIDMPKYYTSDVSYSSSISEDYWGYFNNKQLLSNIPGELMPPGTDMSYMGNRNPDETFMQACILTKVIYPTGGWTEFVFEPNRAQNVYSYSVNTLIGGLRLYQSKNYSSNEVNPEIRTFKYGKNQSGYATRHVLITQEMFQDHLSQYEQSFVSGIGCGTSIDNYINDYLYMAGESLLPLTLNNTSTVFYDEVVEYFGNDITNKGKVVYSFVDNFPDDSELDDSYLEYSGPRFKSSFQWDRGFISPLLGAKLTFPSGASSPIETIYYEYSSFKDYAIHMGLNVIKKAYFIDYDEPPVEWERLASGNYIYSDTKAFTKVELLTKETRIVDGVTTVTNYYYDSNSHLLPTRKVTTCSRTNSTIETQTRYPSDINSGVYSQMYSRNMLNYPIVETTLKDNNIIGSTIYTYKAVGSSYVLDSILSLETTTPLTSISTFNGTANSIDNHYGKAEIRYKEYDEFGNVIKYTTKDGIVTNILWGYNKLYPVAKVVSGSDFSINKTIRDNIANRSFSSSYVKVSIDADITFLKGSTALSSFVNNPNYHVELYTYNPLVGITSQTDQTGITTFYQYDSFGRLKHVIDNDGKLLKKNEYHYSGM